MLSDSDDDSENSVETDGKRHPQKTRGAIFSDLTPANVRSPKQKPPAKEAETKVLPEVAKGEDKKKEKKGFGLQLFGKVGSIRTAMMETMTSIRGKSSEPATADEDLPPSFMQMDDKDNKSNNTFAERLSKRVDFADSSLFDLRGDGDVEISDVEDDEGPGGTWRQFAEDYQIIDGVLHADIHWNGKIVKRKLKFDWDVSYTIENGVFVEEERFGSSLYLPTMEPELMYQESQTPLASNTDLMMMNQNKSEREMRREAARRKAHYIKIKERDAQARHYGNIWFEKDQLEFFRCTLDAVLLMILVMMASTYVATTSDNYLQTQSISNAITKTPFNDMIFSGISTAGQMYMFVHTILFPFCYENPYALYPVTEGPYESHVLYPTTRLPWTNVEVSINETNLAPDTAFMSSNNMYMMGGLRLFSRSYVTGACSVEGFDTCLDRGKVNEEDLTFWKNVKDIEQVIPFGTEEEQNEQSFYRTSYGTYKGEGHYFDFPPRGEGAREKAHKQFDALYLNGFFSSNTRVVTFHIRYFNPNTRLTTMLRLTFDFVSSGGVYAHEEIMTWDLLGHKNVSIACLTGLIFILLIFVYDHLNDLFIECIWKGDCVCRRFLRNTAYNYITKRDDSEELVLCPCCFPSESRIDSMLPEDAGGIELTSEQFFADSEDSVRPVTPSVVTPKRVQNEGDKSNDGIACNNNCDCGSWLRFLCSLQTETPGTEMPLIDTYVWNDALRYDPSKLQSGEEKNITRLERIERLRDFKWGWQARLKHVYRHPPSALSTFRLLYEASNEEALRTGATLYDLQSESVPDPLELPLNTVIFFKFYEPTWVYLIIHKNSFVHTHSITEWFESLESSNWEVYDRVLKDREHQEDSKCEKYCGQRFANFFQPSEHDDGKYVIYRKKFDATSRYEKLHNQVLKKGDFVIIPNRVIEERLYNPSEFRSMKTMMGLSGKIDLDEEELRDSWNADGVPSMEDTTSFTADAMDTMRSNANASFTDLLSSPKPNHRVYFSAGTKMMDGSGDRDKPRASLRLTDHGIRKRIESESSAPENINLDSNFEAEVDSEGFCYGRIEQIKSHLGDESYYKVRIYTGLHRRLSLKFNLANESTKVAKIDEQVVSIPKIPEDKHLKNNTVKMRIAVGRDVSRDRLFIVPFSWLFGKGCTSYYSQVWNFWGAVFLCLVAFYVYITIQILNEIKEEEILERQEYVSLRKLHYLLRSSQINIAFLIFFIVFRFSRYLSLFLREVSWFHQMLRIMIDAFSSFAVFLILFWMAFALMGWVLFNSNMPEFRNIWYSAISLVKFIIYTDTDLNNSIDFDQSMIQWFYFLVWNAVVSLILINVFIAIIVDAYNKVQSSKTPKGYFRAVLSELGYKLRRCMRCFRDTEDMKTHEADNRKKVTENMKYMLDSRETWFRLYKFGAPKNVVVTAMKKLYGEQLNDKLTDELFDMIDDNKNQLVSEDEWDEFVQFLQPVLRNRTFLYLSHKFSELEKRNTMLEEKLSQIGDLGAKMDTILNRLNSQVRFGAPRISRSTTPRARQASQRQSAKLGGRESRHLPRPQSMPQKYSRGRSASSPVHPDDTDQLFFSRPIEPEKKTSLARVSEKFGGITIEAPPDDSKG